MIRRALSPAASAAESAIAAVPGAPPELSQSEVIGEVENRTWPEPRGPWLMAQTWRDLLFAHWRVAPGVLERALPAALPVDIYDGHGWIGVTPFELCGLRPRGGIPLPGISRFPELKYRLPYFRARMQLTRRGPAVHYRSERASSGGAAAEFEAEYSAAGEPFKARPGSLDHFLAERYCLYTVDEAGRPLRGEIQHPPWPLQPAKATIARNTMTAPWGIDLPDEEPVLHLSRLQNVVIWPLRPAAD